MKPCPPRFSYRARLSRNSICPARQRKHPPDSRARRVAPPHVDRNPVARAAQSQAVHCYRSAAPVRSEGRRCLTSRAFSSPAPHLLRRQCAFPFCTIPLRRLVSHDGDRRQPCRSTGELERQGMPSTRQPTTLASRTNHREKTAPARAPVLAARWVGGLRRWARCADSNAFTHIQSMTSVNSHVTAPAHSGSQRSCASFLCGAVWPYCQPVRKTSPAAFSAVHSFITSQRKCPCCRCRAHLSETWCRRGLTPATTYPASPDADWPQVPCAPSLKPFHDFTSFAGWLHERAFSGLGRRCAIRQEMLRKPRRRGRRLTSQFASHRAHQQSAPRLRP